MNSYRFILEDYHAVKNADIILDGLTVLAGLNGCGKSTILRCLYGLMNAEHDSHSKGRFSGIMGLKRVIYIDNSISGSSQDKHIYNILTDPIYPLINQQKSIQKGTTLIIEELSVILGGGIVIQDGGQGRRELRYIRKSDGLNISIEDMSAGMKSFAYILRLLQNGYIDSETLLIIDEPEAHLHPQWIVKFAKVLVLIQKYLGAKVMVASHDPDMVAAISAMAEAEGLSDVTNFYQASKAPGELRYCFENSGNDISRIFESFNIALDGIDSYKASDFS